MATVALALRLTVSFVLVAAAFGKVRSPGSFAGFVMLVAEIGVPTRWVRPACAATIAGEALTALAVPWPLTGAASAGAAALIFALFTAGVARAVRRGLTAQCHCFGPTGQRLRRLHVVRNAALTALASAALAATVPTPAGGPAALPGVLIATVVAVLGATVVVRLEDLAFLVGPLASSGERGSS